MICIYINKHRVICDFLRNYGAYLVSLESLWEIKALRSVLERSWTDERKKNQDSARRRGDCLVCWFIVSSNVHWEWEKKTTLRVTGAANKTSLGAHAERHVSHHREGTGYAKEGLAHQKRGEKKSRSRVIWAARLDPMDCDWKRTYVSLGVFCQSFGGDLTDHTTLRKDYVCMYSRRCNSTHVWCCGTRGWPTRWTSDVTLREGNWITDASTVPSEREAGLPCAPLLLPRSSATLCAVYIHTPSYTLCYSAPSPKANMYRRFSLYNLAELICSNRYNPFQRICRATYVTDWASSLLQRLFLPAVFNYLSLFYVTFDAETVLHVCLGIGLT